MGAGTGGELPRGAAAATVYDIAAATAPVWGSFGGLFRNGVDRENIFFAERTCALLLHFPPFLPLVEDNQ